jgi:hypothetical protein
MAAKTLKRLPSHRQKGYGYIRWQGKSLRVSHLIWAEANGPIPPDKPHVLHECDNPPCCNPAHLWTGTHKENMADAAAKGRMRGGFVYGERNGSAKLTEATVRAIRAADGTQYAIATRFGINRENVRDIRKGKTWRHLP